MGQLSFRGRMLLPAVLLLSMLAAPAVAGAQPDQTCEPFPETNQEICGLFLTYWENNGGLPVFGMPVTAQFSELSSDTLAQQEVQYYERERFEHHPENDGTPYVILLGRLGVDLLEFNGIDWMQFPTANPTDVHYMEATGQAIAPEFWDYWSSHGLDFGDDGVSFRESLALFGYPVSPPSMETNGDGDTVLTQWFERARFELHEDGTVLLGRLGAEMNDSDGQFAIRVQLELDTMFQQAFDDFQSHGTIANVRIPGVGEWAGNVGQADPSTGAPYANDTHQRVGSITKTFTATMILQLVDQELLSLDDTVDQWFDGVTYGDQITVRMLAQMTSGIASYTLSDEWAQQVFDNPEKVWSPQEVVDYGIGLPPSFEPGTGWEYSNTNYVMLGLIIEAVTGQDIRTVLHEQILDPLGLSSTSFPAQDDDSLPAPYARGMTVQGQPEDEPVDATNWNPSWAWTAGQMISTLDDIHVWGRVLGTGELLSPESQAQREEWVQIAPTAYYGLGISDYSGWIGHNGELPGYNSDIWYRPDLDSTILVFTNSDIDNAVTTPSRAVFFGIVTIMNREYPLPPTS